jgi:hypothetical protein
LLRPAGFDGLFKTFTVTNVHWSFTNNGAAMSVTGSGTYKIGGSNAPQQQLSLNLQLNGGQAEHFDSGLVADSTLLPDINVAISTNGQICFDTVFKVSASPTPVPQLLIRLTPANTVVLSWAVSPEPFNLQATSGPATTDWTTVTNPPVVISQQNQVTLPLCAGAVNTTVSSQAVIEKPVSPRSARCLTRSPLAPGTGTSTFSAA